nr:helix-turn-helix domain-containing protein [Endozoicomonas ascidiicola]
MAYTHLSLEERHYTELQLKEGVSQNKIAKVLGRSQSTFSRELGRVIPGKEVTDTSKPMEKLKNVIWKRLNLLSSLMRSSAGLHEISRMIGVPSKSQEDSKRKIS